MTFDRETIGAFVDGELNEIARRRLDAALAKDPELARQVEAERNLRALLRARFDPVMDAPVPERILAAVGDAANVAPLPKRRTWGPPQWAAMAATLALGVMAGQLLRPGGDIVQRGGGLVASASLAHALETQLASAQDARAPVRIGLTFKARDGAWCRTFAQSSFEGIACRGTGGWQVRRTASGNSEAGDYRQAGSGDLAAAAQDMAATAPLDAGQERKVVSGGWK